MNDRLIQAQGIQDQLIAWRRDFHTFPELGFHERRTAARVADAVGHELAHEQAHVVERLRPHLPLEWVEAASRHADGIGSAGKPKPDLSGACAGVHRLRSCSLCNFTERHSREGGVFLRNETRPEEYPTWRTRTPPSRPVPDRPIPSTT